MICGQRIIGIGEDLYHARQSGYSGRGRRPKRPWHSVETWSQSLGDEAWQRIDVRDGGKKWTPAMTLPQIRQGIAMILHETFQCGAAPNILKECQRRLQRNELARFYHWKRRNRLPPLNLHKRQF